MLFMDAYTFLKKNTGSFDVNVNNKTIIKKTGNNINKNRNEKNISRVRLIKFLYIFILN